MALSVLITGAAGYLGHLVTRALAEQAPAGTILTATDVREPPAVPGVDNRVLDIRSPDFADVLRDVNADVVVHLAAIVTPPPGATRDFLHTVEVQGTDNVLRACVSAGVTKVVYTSSGAAYGYHPDNPPLLFEDEPLRATEGIVYSWHKRLVEELLAQLREEHPALQQLVFRVSTILGPSVNNPITALFERPVVVGIRGVDSPFCLVWDEDVVQCLVLGTLGDQTGTYNLTGDGVMTLREIARGMKRRYIALPHRLLKRVLAGLHKRKLSAFGAEQTAFLRHRPVMDNSKLKREFGYTPQKTSREVFALYRSHRV